MSDDHIEHFETIMRIRSPDSRIDRAKIIRGERQCSVQEAVAVEQYEFITRQIKAATSLEDVKGILQTMLNTQVCQKLYDLKNSRGPIEPLSSALPSTPSAPAAQRAPEPIAETGKVHVLKTWPRYFDDVLRGRKPFEWRVDDRYFAVGDTLVLQEWEPERENLGCKEGRYTGREIKKLVSYVFNPFPTNKRTAIMALSAVTSTPSAPVAQQAPWQPIETAPKDRVIVARNGNGDRFHVWWQDGAFKGFPIPGGIFCVPFLADWSPALPSTHRGCGDPNCKDPDCTYGEGPNNDPISSMDGGGK